MGGRHQPEAGADSQDYTLAQMDALQGDADEYQLRPFRVYVVARWDEDDRGRWVQVAAALGPHDAYNQVRESHPDCTVLKAEAA